MKSALPIPDPHPAPDTVNKRATWTQNVELVGDELVAFVKKLATDGKVSRIRIVEADGDIIVDMPLTLGAIAGGAVVLAAPLLAILGALAAFVTKVRLEIVRSGEQPAGPGPGEVTAFKQPAASGS